MATWWFDEIWWITLKNNRAPLLCYFKPCALFHSHRSIHTVVKIRKRQIRVKIGFFCPGWLWNLTDDLVPLLCCFKLCASFRTRLWILTGVTARKHPMWVKIGYFFVPCDLEIWQMTLKNNRVPHQAWCITSSSYVNSNWSYGPETAKLGIDLGDLDVWPLTSTFCMNITSVNGNKFHDDTMMEAWWKRCDRQTTDRQTDGRQKDRRTEVFLELLGPS